MITRIPLDIVARQTGARTSGVIVAVLVDELDAMEAQIDASPAEDGDE